MVSVTPSQSSVEYVIRDENDNIKEVHVPGDAERKANITRAAQLLNKIRAEKALERKMLRAAINLESLYVRKVKNRKRDKLAKASRKKNRRRK